MTPVIPPRQRGACPTLSEPMPTGDGLLARINPINGALSPADLAGIAEAAKRFGNGLLEITLRGSLQIRGLSDETVADMNAAVGALGVTIRNGLPLDIAPLAGLCAAERADSRPLADALRNQTAAFAAKLGPKVSVVIDGGGPSMLHGVKADIRLTALDADTWRVAIAGDAGSAQLVGVYNTEDAVQSAVALLHTIAEGGRKARGRDLLPAYNTAESAQSRETDPPQLRPGDVLELTDRRFAGVVALPFGTVTAATVIGLCAELQTLGIGELRLSPGRMLIMLCPDCPTAEAALDRSARFDVITSPNDPRLRIVACAGAPACASAHLDTRALAADLAVNWADGKNLPFLLHLSGCEKQCSKPAGTFISVIGMPGSRKIVANGTAVPADFAETLSNIPSMQRAS